MRKTILSLLVISILLLAACTAPSITQTVTVTITTTPTNTPTLTVTSTTTSTITVTTTPTVTVTPPATTSPPTTTIVPTGEEIVVLSSNVFNTTSSILLDGESRRLHMVAELRNDSSVYMEIDKVSFHFYNASGAVVCKRWAYAFDDILPPGGITAVAETVPSQIYWDSETNDFPEDWTTYEINISAQTTDEKPVEVTIQNVEVTVDPGGLLKVTGSVLNTSQETAKYIKPYAIFYVSDGTILNTDQALGSINELKPGESQDFEIWFLSGEPVDYDHYIVKAYAEG
jgi:hypothetical protein